MRSATAAALRGLFGVSSAVTPSIAARAAGAFFRLPLGPRRVAIEITDMPRPELFAISGDDGACIEGYAWRLDSDRPRVLLAHGWGGWGLQWAPWIAPLLDAGYQVVSFDQPGHGRSSGWTADGASFERAILRVARDFGPFAAIIGHSFGAAIGSFAVANGLPARAMVLIACPSDLIDATRSFARTVGLSEATRSRMQRHLEAKIGIRMETFSVRAVGHMVRLPGLVIHDRHDREVPFACATHYEQYWSGPIELMPTNGLGHRRIVKAPRSSMLGFSVWRACSDRCSNHDLARHAAHVHLVVQPDDRRPRVMSS